MCTTHAGCPLESGDICRIDHVGETDVSSQQEDPTPLPWPCDGRECFPASSLHMQLNLLGSRDDARPSEGLEAGRLNDADRDRFTGPELLHHSSTGQEAG